MGRLTHGDDRPRVVHPHRADDRHGAQVTLGQPVVAGHQRQRAQRRHLVLAADPHVDVALVERSREHPEQRHAALERVEQLVELRDVLEAVLGQQARSAVDVEGVLGGHRELGEGGRELRDERALARLEPGVVELGLQHARADAHARELLVEIGRRPVGQTGIDRLVEGEHALRHAARRGDDHHHQHLRLQRQHLDVAQGGGGDRRRGDDRQQVRDLRERLGGDAHRLVDLAADERELELGLRLAARRQQPVDEVAVAGVGRHAPGGGVRVREQTLLLEH